ncbi:uncharacterized protein LOC143353863 [Halictus rubicundus]|uniref:uncharacterized protein LOC143353863 n=1 Tax=Halictus rubicundus TaxID=77578 RepID=UPI004036FAC7
MFARRRRTSKTSDSTSDVTISFVAWQKLLVVLLTLVPIGFLIWPRYGTRELTKFESLDNISRSSIASMQTNLFTVETTTVRKNVGYLLDQRSSPSPAYCRITACPTVICSSIPKTVDVGNVTSVFIETIFKAECKDATVKLSLNNSSFLSNSLRKNWLSTSLSIEELELDSCSLREIEDDAFDHPSFEGTKKLTLLKNRLTSLRKAAFRPLTSLEKLIIRENFIEQVESNLLENAAGSLSNLDLNGVIDDPLFLRNITGGKVLKKLEILSLRGNFISEITDESFRGAPNVQSLYLINSGIVSMSRGSLEPMSSSIIQLFLTENKISSLPKGIFDSMLQRQKPFRVELNANGWNCDCGLQWMQDLINTHPNVITSSPICSSPSENAGKSFIAAEFCPFNSTGPAITTSTTHNSQTTTKKPEMIAVTCSIPEFFPSPGGSRKLLSTDLEFPSGVPGFLVDSVTDKSIVLKLPSLEQGLALLWFDNGSPKRSVSCAKHVRRSYHVQNVDPETSYTICLLTDNEDTVSPLNCLAATTLPAYMSRTWLRNADKAQTVILLTLVVATVFFIGIFATFLIVWKYPSLLQGSKRVMLVKKNELDAIVLPKGVNVEKKGWRRGGVAQGDNKVEDGYITPLPPAPLLPPRTSRISRVSLLSDWHSYVSEVEPTETQLTSWGLARLHSDLENQTADAPPLPPYPLNDVSSLSLTVEAKTHDAEYEMSSV